MRTPGLRAKVIRVGGYVHSHMHTIIFLVVLAAVLALGAYATRSQWLSRLQPQAQPQAPAQGAGAGRDAVDQLWRRADALRRQVNVNDQRQLKMAMDNPPPDIEGRYALLCMVYREAAEFLKMAKGYGWTDAAVNYKLDALTAATKQLSEFYMKDQAGQLKPSRSLASADWFRAMSGETCTAFEASRFIFEAARSAKAKPA